MGTLALANIHSGGLCIKAFSCYVITNMLNVGEKLLVLELSPLLLHDFTPLILGLIIPISYRRGLLLNLKME